MVLRSSTTQEAFGYRLLAQVLAGRGPNALISPLGATVALSLAATGARGTAREGILRVLPAESADNSSLDAARLVNRLRSPGAGTVLELANSLWVRTGFGLARDHVELLHKSFGAVIQSLDFAEPESRDVINDWVKLTTHGLIRRVICRIDAEAFLYLINAIYFHSPWADPFDPYETADGYFRTASRTRRRVRMMQRAGQFEYAEGPDLTAVRLPYLGGRFDLSLLVADEWLSSSDYAAAFESGRPFLSRLTFLPRRGIVRLPKFRLASATDILMALASLGMQDAFGAQADFSGLTADGRSPGGISGVLQSTILAVDEAGTTAASTTVVEQSIGASLLLSSEFVMILDRPFVVALVERETGVVLLLGVIGDPCPATAVAGPPTNIGR